MANTMIETDTTPPTSSLSESLKLAVAGIKSLQKDRLKELAGDEQSVTDEMLPWVERARHASEKLQALYEEYGKVVNPLIPASKSDTWANPSKGRGAPSFYRLDQELERWQAAKRFIEQLDGVPGEVTRISTMPANQRAMPLRALKGFIDDWSEAPSRLEKVTLPAILQHAKAVQQYLGRSN